MSHHQDTLRATASSSIVAGVFALAAVALLWYLFDVLLLIFGAVLLAVLIDAPTRWISARTGLPRAWSLAGVLLTLTLVVTFAVWMLGSAVSEQSKAIAEQVPQMLEQVRERTSRYDWIPERLDAETVLQDEGKALLGRGMQVVSATFGAVANLGLVVFMAVLFAAQPDLYVRGVLRLTPLHKRQRAQEILHRSGETLRRWLLGQLCLMVLVGVCSTLGLWLLDVPYALALGLLAGVLTFVPFLGPLLAAVVAILVSLADGVMAAVWVGVLYLGIQAIEGLLEPIVQQRAVYLPPVLLLATQVVLGVLVGVLGIVLATPLAAVLLVVVQMLYVEDFLGDRA